MLGEERALTVRDFTVDQLHMMIVDWKGKQCTQTVHAMMRVRFPGRCTPCMCNTVTDVTQDRQATPRYRQAQAREYHRDAAERQGEPMTASHTSQDNSIQYFIICVDSSYLCNSISLSLTKKKFANGYINEGRFGPMPVSMYKNACCSNMPLVINSIPE